MKPELSQGNPPVFDGHNDTVFSLLLDKRRRGGTFFDRSEAGHLDLPRAAEGGFGGGFFAMMVPPARSRRAESQVIFTETGYEVPMSPPVKQGRAFKMIVGALASLFRIETESQGKVKVVRTADELKTCLRDGVLAAAVHLEGAEPIGPDLDALEVLHRAGLRSLGIVWSRPNRFGHGVPFRFPHSPDTGPGLTDEGKELVRACNRLGIMIDLSHLNERGFWDVAGLSDRPLVATHSNAHALCPSTRNLTDRQLDAVRDSDGMVGVNFSVSFLRPDGKRDSDTPLSLIADHVDYLVERLGIDRVGLGSDFDGATIPAELGDVTGLPKLIEEFRRHGYDEPALAKIAYENWSRVLADTWKASA